MPRIDGILSWNMGCGIHTNTDSSARTRRLELLRELIDTWKPSLIALQETPPEAELRNCLPGFGLITTTGGVAAGYREDRWSADITDDTDPRVAIAGLAPVGASASVWLLSVHVPVMFKSSEQRASFIRTKIAQPLKACRARDALRLSIVAGDMNTPPFDYVIVSKEGLHANRSLRWAATNSSGIDQAMFNPTWILLGRYNDAPGTFYRSSVESDGPWFGSDQILLSPAFAEHSGFSVIAIDQVAQKKLRKKGQIGAPDDKIGSDHLPLFAALGVA